VKCRLITLTNSKWRGRSPAHPMSLLVWNASGSVPIGLYRVRPAGKLSVNDLVIVMPPDPLAAFLADSGYLARGVPLTKRILALSGQTVCRRDLLIIVDGIEIGTTRKRDGRGHSLLDWQGCLIVGTGEVLLMNLEALASLDGRDFGVMPVNSIVGRATPLWTFEER
jgi:type IV secretory pathway protease TraF